jgi:hypothetical protein
VPSLNINLLNNIFGLFVDKNALTINKTVSHIIKQYSIYDLRTLGIIKILKRYKTHAIHVFSKPIGFNISHHERIKHQNGTILMQVDVETISQHRELLSYL